jgi:hypothetical protein
VIRLVFVDEKSSLLNQKNGMVGYDGGKDEKRCVWLFTLRTGWYRVDD